MSPQTAESEYRLDGFAHTQQFGPRIPYDLQEQVVKSLFSESEGKWPEADSLANCAATCRDWKKIAIPGLYKRIEIIGRNKYQILKNTLRKNEIGLRVHTLSIHDVTPEERISRAALHTLPQRLDQLKELLMFGPYGSENAVFHVHPTLFVTLSQFRSVRRLHLQQIVLASLDALRRIVATLPNVETAVFRSISWKTSESAQFRPLHNATSWQLSQFSLCDCSSDFVAPLFWAMPPRNASESSRRRSLQRANGFHPSIHEADVLPILELAKFVLNPPEKMVGSICWEWRFLGGQEGWCLECCIDERRSSDSLTCVYFYFSPQHLNTNPVGSQLAGRVNSIEILTNEQTGFDAKQLNSLLEDFECFRRVILKFGRVGPNARLQMIANQIPALAMPGSQMWCNGVLYGSDNHTMAALSEPLIRSERQQDVCTQIRTWIVSQRILLLYSLIGLSNHPCVRMETERRVDVSKGQVRIYRELANVGHDRHDGMSAKRRARALNRANKAEQCGRALQYQQDQMGAMITHALRNDSPYKFRPRLLDALSNTASDLRRLGRREEALEYSKEEVDLSRILAKEDSSTFRPRLADALSNAASDLRRLGRCEAALEHDKEEVYLRRILAKNDPSTSRPCLADALSNTASDLRRLGRCEEALEYGKEEVDLTRILAQEDPSTFRPRLVDALRNTASDFGRLGQHEEGSGHGKAGPERIFKSLSTIPVVFKFRDPDASRRCKEVLEYCKEEMNLVRILAEDDPSAYRPRLAEVLGNTASYLSRFGRHNEALKYGEEGLNLSRMLAEDDPSTYRPHLAKALRNTASYLRHLGRFKEASEHDKEEANLNRILSMRGASTFRPRVADALINTTSDFNRSGRYEEGVNIARILAAEDPYAFQPRLAHSNPRERYEEALKYCEEVVNLTRTHAEDDPSTYRPRLAEALINTASYLSQLGRDEEALKYGEEGLKLSRTLARDDPYAFRPYLADALRNSAFYLMQVGLHKEALDVEFQDWRRRYDAAAEIRSDRGGEQWRLSEI